MGLGNDIQGSRAYINQLSLELIHLLLEKQQYNLVLIGDKNDAKRNNFYFDQIPQELRGRILNYSGKTDVGTHINIIKKLDVLITIDTSPMHVAVMVLTPFIVLLGKSTSAFSTVQPKVDFGVYLKRENNLLDDSLFISHITPLEIIAQIESFF
ncbi:glycosyltransferase family 9 protein [Labilibaculum euxinus]